jgi:hypothetical protein
MNPYLLRGPSAPESAHTVGEARLRLLLLLLLLPPLLLLLRRLLLLLLPWRAVPTRIASRCGGSAACIAAIRWRWRPAVYLPTPRSAIISSTISGGTIVTIHPG